MVRGGGGRRGGVRRRRCDNWGFRAAAHAGLTVDQKSRRGFVFMNLGGFSNRAKCRLEIRDWRRWVRTFLDAARGVWIEMLQGRLKLEGMAAFVWSELRGFLIAGAQIRNWGEGEEWGAGAAVVRMRRVPPASAGFGAPAHSGD